MKKLSIIAILLSSTTLFIQLFVFSTQKEGCDDVYSSALQDNYKIYSPVLPTTLSFANEAVPMDIYYVREALDREILTNTYWHTNTILIMKRAYRFFPDIEAILKKNGIPTDFKYLCVIESSLMNVTSPAKAQGFWQFMPATGKKYNLEINEEVDMRNDLEAATEAACKYLHFLHDKFGSWTLAAAAYNCGENGLERQIDLQGEKSLYNLRLNSETSRYVYRILAMKLIMQNPKAYGFQLRNRDMYCKLPFRTITVSDKNVDLYQLAKDNNTSYKMLKEMNPWLISNKLTNKNGKTYTLKLPVDGGTLVKNIRKANDEKAQLIKGF